MKDNRRTIRNFLSAALQPVGTVLYIYGGGWNQEDTGGNAQSVQIGLSKEWICFFRNQDESYSYRPAYYPVKGRNIYGCCGLDCSGYVGWAVFNTLHTRSGGASYVVRASEMAQQYARWGWGTFCAPLVRSGEKCAEMGFCAGDIFSMEGHVWICVGVCRDGSIVILHSTPSESRIGCAGGGVQIGALGESEACEAYRLADFYMCTFYPEWSRRYRTALKSRELYTKASCGTCGRFRWNRRTLADPDGFCQMRAREILQELFDRPAHC